MIKQFTRFFTIMILKYIEDLKFNQTKSYSFRTNTMQAAFSRKWRDILKTTEACKQNISGFFLWLKLESSIFVQIFRRIVVLKTDPPSLKKTGIYFVR